MKKFSIIVNKKKKIKRFPVLECGPDTRKKIGGIKKNQLKNRTEHPMGRDSQSPNDPRKESRLNSRDASEKKFSKKSIKRTPVSGPLIISYTDPSDDPEGFKKAAAEVLKDFSSEISTEAGWLETLTETPTDYGYKPTILYPYQKDHMNNYNKYRWMNKSRQIGASYGFSGEALAKAHLMDWYTAIFVSYNQEEANEKINYARSIYESIPRKYQRKLIVDRVTALEFEKRTGSSNRRFITRLISHPQRAVRGKGGNVDVILDEFAHFTWDVKIYVAAVPVITRGFGQITLASSPLGKLGLFWQVGEDKVRYPTYTRQYVEWFRCLDFLNTYGRERFEEVQNKAPFMETDERVTLYGSEAIVQAYNSSLFEDFCQEYELRPFDERESYYPLDLIKGCTFEKLRGVEVIDENDEGIIDDKVGVKPVYPGLEYKTYRSIEELSRAVLRGEVSRFLYAGYDVGRFEDASELVILEELKDHNNLQMLRLSITGRKMEFEKQQELIDKMFKYLPIRKFHIDVTGLGKQLGEYVWKKQRSRVERIDFNAANKQEMCADLKIRMEEQLVAYPSDRDLIKQIHSIKREITRANQIRFVVEENRVHHGDKFWALALGSAAGTPIERGVRYFTKMSFGKISNSSNIIVLPQKRKFPKTKDVFIMPRGIEEPPLHINELGATITKVSGERMR